LLIYDNTTFGIHRCELYLSDLYPTSGDLHNFQIRFKQFMDSHPTNRNIFCLEDDRLIYFTETFISDQEDDRPPVLLLLGNPASHSIDAGMCFSFEGDGKEHRFWKGLEKAGILSFTYPASSSEDSVTMNTKRREALMYLDYVSPFRLGIAVFYSMPSAASDPKWSGVSGLKRLFGTKVFRFISEAEERRIDMLISKFLGRNGGIIAFQKDAYNGVRSQNSPVYSRELAAQGSLLGFYRGSKQILLAGSSPTRLMHTDRSQAALLNFKAWLWKQLSQATGKQI
jgi:hypothetical protein